MTVIGVVGDVRFSPTRLPDPTIYLLHAQAPLRSLVVTLKTAVPPASVMPAARRVVRDMNRDMVVRSFVLSDRIQQGSAMIVRRFAAWLLGGLAAVATLMALLGIYSVLAYAVAQRTHELGIRMALGASRVSVIRHVMDQAMVMGAIGVAAGSACAVAAVHAVRAMLVVSPADPATLASVGLLVLLVVGVAAFAPARRATNVDPMRALRSE